MLSLDMALAETCQDSQCIHNLLLRFRVGYGCQGAIRRAIHQNLPNTAIVHTHGEHIELSIGLRALMCGTFFWRCFLLFRRLQVRDDEPGYQSYDSKPNRNKKDFYRNIAHGYGPPLNL
ncbi:MAG: hypothetical protein BWY63_01079 [Chloroflexi bacterium ADurb.Bin360]|nr:MAG: hypothetical protein BWY63_01079 [Chloroflexi bacterium ADurb.Bin360]